MQPIDRRAGFSLIELLVTLAVAAILVAMAVASYDFATVKTRRGAAKGCLAEAAQAMERHYTANFSYAGATLPACSTDVAAHYALGFATGEPTASSYRLEAVPQGRQASSDATCGTLTIDNTGVKGAGDNAVATIDACW
jgi:prepilin-type N-terminal cleavage/methylation domain